MNLQVVSIFVSPGHSYWTQGLAEPLQFGINVVSEVECISGRGLRGDRYSTGKLNRKGQVTFISEAAIEEIRAEFQLPQLEASVFRRNVVVRGADLAKLLNEQFEIQGVLFEGVQECKPCEWMDRMVAPGAQKFMQKHFRGGLRAKILCDGILKVDANATIPLSASDTELM